MAARCFPYSEPGRRSIVVHPSRRSTNVNHDPLIQSWPPGVERLAEAALPEFLCRQRWYPAKDAGKPGVKLSALLPFPISGVTAAIAVWRVTPSGNAPMHLFVPLALLPAQAADAAQVIAELPAREGDGGQGMRIVEAFSVDAFVGAWLDLLLRNGEEARGPVRLRTGSTEQLARAGLEAGGG